MAAILVVPPPNVFFVQPMGTYGISFDLTTRSIRDDLPDGWNFSSTAPVYIRIRDLLQTRGYVHPQGSVYQRLNTLAGATWLDMMAMRAIAPIGLLPSVLKAIQMFHIAQPIMVSTNQMILGGAYSPQLLGPTPTNLVPANVAAVHMNAAPNPLPLNVRNSPNANQGNNWVT